MELYEGRYEVRFALNAFELKLAQKLRYRVFVEEFAAKSFSENENQLEFDDYDPFCKHLLLIDTKSPAHESSNPKVVGVTRIMTEEQARNGIGFYSEGEYDLLPILNSKRKLMELGRSCIESAYRSSFALYFLWKELGDYVRNEKVEILFGVASFRGTELTDIEMALSYLYYSYLAPLKLRPRALVTGYQTMERVEKKLVNREKALNQMPALLKSYLRLGAVIGDGAFIDHRFNTIDVMLIIDTLTMLSPYKEYNGRIS